VSKLPWRPVDHWLAATQAPPDGPTRALLARLYGPDETLWAARTRLWRAALTAWRAAYGQGDVLLARAPGRISLNPHSDHQGCFVLYGCHAREMVVVAGRRDDDRFRLVNADPAYADDLAFGLREELDRAPAAWARGWTDYLEDHAVKAAVAAQRDPKSRGSGRRGTLNYVKAAVLRLAAACPDAPWHGLDLALAGDIPPAAGQSSSSAIVTATALALRAVWDLALDDRELVALLGEAEWYVGTRGGSGDHAAMLLGARGQMVNVRFEPPVRVLEQRSVAFPSGYQVLLANSGVRSEKSSAEKRLFNRGVFAYKFAFAELRRILSERRSDLGLDEATVDGTRCLADLHDPRLPLGVLYELLLALAPETSPTVLRRRYPELFDAAARSFFDTDDPTLLPVGVPLRGAALYGLGRADRGLVQDRLLAAGNPEAMVEFGRLCSITHDGDRRFVLGADGALAPYRANLDALADDALRRAQTAGLPLRRQAGYYGASIGELDRIVDLVTPLPGVLGAGLMGAGGGGVVLIVAHDDPRVTAAVAAALDSAVAGLERWVPAAGAGVLA
jgi:N-acetylgalactosamine kinase